MKKAWQYLQYLGAAGTARFIALFPRSWYFPFARFLARFLMLIPQMGRVSVQNVRAAYPDLPEKECRAMARSGIANLLVTMCEFFWLNRRKKITVTDLVETDPETDAMMADLLKDSQAGKGTLFITPHHGNWEFSGQLLAAKYHFPMSTIVRFPQNPYIGRLLTGGRAVENVDLIESKGAARGIVSALKQGRCIGLLVDQNVRARDGGVFVNFFGLPVPVTALPAHLARKYDLKIAVGGMVHVGNRLFFCGKQIQKRSADFESDEALTQEITSRVEDVIRAHPEQNLWMYRRFQYIPPDTPPEIRARYPAYACEPSPSFYDQRQRHKH